PHAGTHAEVYARLENSSDPLLLSHLDALGRERADVIVLLMGADSLLTFVKKSCIIAFSTRRV
ncbi:MAG: hypothetical protein ABSB41_18365, partial [Anaerolineales bacterium]